MYYPPVILKTVFNRNGRLNKRGLGLIQIELKQGEEKHYYSWGLRVSPQQWDGNMVTNCEEEFNLNCQINERNQFLSNSQTDYYICNKKYPSSMELLRIVNDFSVPSAYVEDFVDSHLKNCNKKKSTIRNYKTLVNDVEKYRKKTRIADLDYNFIVGYDKHMKKNGLSNNTIIGRHQLLKALINESVKKKINTENPYTNFPIPQMANKKGHLTKQQMEKIEKKRDSLPRKLQKICDGFLFCCGTGLRYSDFVKLKNEDIKNKWIHFKTQKTNVDVDVPTTLLNNVAQRVIDRNNNDIEKLARNFPQNGAANQLLKEVFDKCGVEHESQHFTFHTARHTFATLLREVESLPETTIQKLLGHTKIQTSLIYIENTKETLKNDLKKYLKRQ